MTWEKTIQEHCSYLWALKSPFICFAFVIFVLVLPVCPCIHSCSLFFCVDVTFDSSLQEFPLVAKSRSSNREDMAAIPWQQYIMYNYIYYIMYNYIYHIMYNQHFCLCFSLYILMFCLQLEVYCLYPFTQSSSQCVWLSVHREWWWHHCVPSSVCTCAHTQVKQPALSSWHPYRCKRCSSVFYFISYWETCLVPSAACLWFVTIKGNRIRCLKQVSSLYKRPIVLQLENWRNS